MSRTDKSNDFHRSNANNSIDTNANGPLTRARARLLLHSASSNVDNPCQLGSRPQGLKHPSKSNDSENDRAPSVQRSRPERLESMEIISKT